MEEIGIFAAIRRGGYWSLKEYHKMHWQPAPLVGFIGQPVENEEQGICDFPVHFILPDKDHWSVWRMDVASALDQLVCRFDNPMHLKEHWMSGGATEFSPTVFVPVLGNPSDIRV